MTLGSLGRCTSTTGRRALRHASISHGGWGTQEAEELHSEWPSTNNATRYNASSAAPTDPTKLLAQQRLRRPVAPHLTIYRPQVTWYLSGLHRITGIILSGPLYLFATAYLAAPLFGWHLESASLAASFATLPAAAQVGLKSLFAFPFTYHCMNGLRHLTWDTGRGIDNKLVIKTGWTVVGLSVASALYLAFL